MYYDKWLLKNRIIILLSIFIIIASTSLTINEYYKEQETYNITYKYVNIKDMTVTKVATKISNRKITNEVIDNTSQSLGNNEEQVANKQNLVEVALENINEKELDTTPQRIWYLPIENGVITQYPNYYHVAYDIISSRGVSETVFPIANGVISGIYTDIYGALIITVLHTVDDVKYTSQYVHLANYAEGLYVGKEVTINDALGQMGSTGLSSGVHLHITVLDCELFNPNDQSCPDLAAWYNYDKKRLSEGFYGLGILVDVPESWESR